MSRSPLILDNGHYVIATSGGEVIEFNSSDHVVKRMKVSDAPISGIKKWKNFYAVLTIGGEFLLITSKLDKFVYSKNGGHSYSSFFGTLQVWKDYLAIFSSRNRLHVFSLEKFL